MASRLHAPALVGEAAWCSAAHGATGDSSPEHLRSVVLQGSLQGTGDEVGLQQHGDVLTQCTQKGSWGKWVGVVRVLTHGMCRLGGGGSIAQRYCP